VEGAALMATLADDRHFPTLAALLDLPPRFAAPAWRFLARLPHNEAIVQQLLRSTAHPDQVPPRPSVRLSP